MDVKEFARKIIAISDREDASEIGLSGSICGWADLETLAHDYLRLTAPMEDERLAEIDADYSRLNKERGELIMKSVDYVLSQEEKFRLAYLTGYVERHLAGFCLRAGEDTRLLDWLLTHSHMSVHGNDERGWVVCNQSNGLTIAGRGKTARAALRAAIAAEQKEK